MSGLTDLIAGGSAWLFIPTAVALGALHGLEPGHSKTMMAAFIVAIRGTVWQAAMLGLSATLSHTAVVWAIALGGLYFGRNLDVETSEPYFQLASAAIIAAVAGWMIWRTWRDRRRRAHRHGRHAHADHHHGHHPHGHDHGDTHEREHAEQIRRHFADRRATTGQIVLFGLTGGLIPCPASITVLLLCLQLKEVALGAALVLSFSVGLAATMVAVGVVAALGVRRAQQRWSHRFVALAQRAPYLSGGLIMLVGAAMAAQAAGALLA